MDDGDVAVDVDHEHHDHDEDYDGNNRNEENTANFAFWPFNLRRYINFPEWLLALHSTFK